MTMTIWKAAALALCVGLAAGSMTTVADASDMKSWQKSVVKKLMKSHIYPRSAIRREIEGRAMVEIRIDRSGAVQDYTVLEPSGEDVLDKVIPKMVAKLDPLPSPPEDASDSQLTVVIPFAWRLQ